MNALYTRLLGILAVWLLVPQLAHAQPTIANPGFESWGPRTVQTFNGPLTFQAPQSWDLGLFSSIFTGFLGLPPHFDQGTVAHSGASSLHVTIPADSLGGDVMMRLAPNGQLAGGLRIWSRASFTPIDSSEGATVFAILTGPQGDTIGLGGGDVMPGTANTWTRFDMPFVFFTPLTQADSILVHIGYYGNTPGRQMWFDDVSFTLRTTGVAAERAAAQPLTISPNPAPEGVEAYASFTAPRAGKAALTLTDALGRTTGGIRIVDLAAGDNRLALPTRGLAPGTYLVRLVGLDGHQWQARLVRP